MLEWQSPAFAEYGFGANDDFRVEPDVESIHGRLTLTVTPQSAAPSFLTSCGLQ